MHIEFLEKIPDDYFEKIPFRVQVLRCRSQNSEGVVSIGVPVNLLSITGQHPACLVSTNNPPLLKTSATRTSKIQSCLLNMRVACAGPPSCNIHQFIAISGSTSDAMRGV